MKIVLSRLRSIISEEINRVISEQPRYPREPTSHRSEMSLSDTKRGAPRASRRAERQFGNRLADYELSMAQAGEEMSLDEYIEQNLYWVWDSPESEYSWSESSADEKSKIMHDLGKDAYMLSQGGRHSLGADQTAILFNSIGDLVNLSPDFEQGYLDAEFDEYMDRVINRDADY
jgi:hypothetical protein